MNRHCSPCSLFCGDCETKGINAESFTLQKKTLACRECRVRLRNTKCRNQGKIRERGHGWLKRASVSCQRAPKATFSKAELLSRPVQSLMELSFNSAFITVFFLPGHAGRAICLFPSAVSLIWMCTAVTVRSGQHTSSLWFQRNSPVFKKSQASTNEPLSYFLNRVKIKVCIIRQSAWKKKSLDHYLYTFFKQWNILPQDNL